MAQDIHKAKDLFQAAMNMGHTKAKVDYQKVCGWIERNESQTSEREQLPDIILVFLQRRQSVLPHVCYLFGTWQRGRLNGDPGVQSVPGQPPKHDADGPALIREYYRIAPAIVEMIERESDRIGRYQRIYDRYISLGYQYLQKRDWARAKATYIELVTSLCAEYGVGFQVNHRLTGSPTHG